LWNAVTGASEDVFQNEHEVNHAAFSPDGKYVAAATGGVIENSGHSTVVWDIAARKPVITLPHEDYARRVAFTPTGRHLATSSDSVSVWDIGSQTPIAVIPDSGVGTEFSPDGTTLVTVTYGAVSLWPHFEKTQALVDFAKSAMARCLTPRERSIFKLDAVPPRWCITGAGQEKEKDSAKWTGAWPYQAKEWKDWLLSKDGPEPKPMPGTAIP
jgi:WD40 repeat protein